MLNPIKWLKLVVQIAAYASLAYVIIYVIIPSI